MARSAVEHLPPRLRAAREHVGLQREVVALAVGRTHSSIVAYEVGRIVPPLPVLERLADLYGVNMADLLSEREPAHA